MENENIRYLASQVCDAICRMVRGDVPAEQLEAFCEGCPVTKMVSAYTWRDAEMEAPPNEGDVLAVCYGERPGCKMAGAFEFASYVGEKWFLDDFCDDDGNDIRVHVTHWMPLPPMPGEDET